MEIPFNITREEVLELSAQKLADAYGDDSDISSNANKKIEDRIHKLFENGLKTKCDNFLTEEMTRIMGTEVCPVNIWGDREGQPTTIKGVLAARAKTFWTEKVDDNGKPTGSDWSGKPRYEHLFQKLVMDELRKAVAENADVIVSQFKETIRTDLWQSLNKKLDETIKSLPKK